MKNKIRLPKKIIQIFSLFFLIIGFFILVNLINKTISPNQNALASYSCSSPNEEVMRTSNQMCFLVCGSHGGYLRQDFNALKCCCKGNGIVPIPSVTVTVTATQPSQLPTQIVPIPTQNQNPRCTFNPSKTCSPGSTWIEYNGFCGCLVNKRCLSETSQLYDTPNHYLSWIEEYKDDKWQMFQTCLYPEPICDTNTFRCVSMGPTGPKKFGEVCQIGSECQSGECDSQYTSYSGDEIILIRKQCTYSLIDQGKFANKRHDTDTKLSLAAASLVVATVTSPLMAPTLHIAAVAGLPAAANYLMLQLQEPWAQNTMATINLTSTLYAISDCAKNETNGEWCNMLAAMATGNPGQFGQVLGNDLKTISGNISRLNIGKYLNLAKTTGKDAMSIIEAERSLSNPYPLANPPKLPKGKQLIGYTFQTNRGGTIRIDKLITTNTIEDVYQATLYDSNPLYQYNGTTKTVTIKFPVDKSMRDVFGVTYSYYEQQILAQGQNSLPVSLRKNLARPYGFAVVETNAGRVELPIIENLGPGQTLESLMKNNTTGKVILSQTEVDSLFDAAKQLDLNKIYIGNIGPETIWVGDDGTLIFSNPKYRPNGWGDFSVVRKFSQGYVSNNKIITTSPHAREIIYFSNKSNQWIWDVPAGNIMALEDMFELWRNRILIR